MLSRGESKMKNFTKIVEIILIVACLFALANCAGSEAGQGPGIVYLDIQGENPDVEEDASDLVEDTYREPDTSPQSCATDEECNDGLPWDFCTSEMKCVILEGESSGICRDRSDPCPHDLYCENDTCFTCDDDDPSTWDPCDDGVGCTDHYCKEGHCAFRVEENKCLVGSACYDAGEKVEGGCVVCDPQSSPTELTVNFDGTACNDDDVCTVDDQCFEGKCEKHNLKNCDDGNPCTTDSCDQDLISGCKYQEVARATSCNDGNVCNGTDICVGKECVHTNALICNDADVCNGNETCDPKTGCKTTPPLACNDGLPCNGEETCDPTSGCILGAAPEGCCTENAQCEDGNVCNGVQECKDGGTCKVTALPLFCDDGNVCNGTETCHASGGCATGQMSVCDDKDSCTVDTCDKKAGCQYAPIIEGKCDDGDPCTLGDSCQAGVCKSPSTQECDDGDVCTHDQCVAGGGCVNIIIGGGACEDGSKCTLSDFCSASGVCTPGNTQNCDDGNSCTNDSCEPATGCKHTNNTNLCNDNNVCTEGDACVSGSCKSGAQKSCTDNVACTTDACHPQNGCTYTTDTTKCSDNNLCTTDVCDPIGGCSNVVPPFACNDDDPCTSDVCDPETGNCLHTDSCEDGDLCTTDVCGADGSCVFQNVVCTDDNVCTDDWCDPDNGCTFAPNSGGQTCNDGNDCTFEDTCDNGVCEGATSDLDADGEIDGETCDNVFDAYCGKGFLPPGHSDQIGCVTGCKDASNTLRYFGGPLPAYDTNAYWACLRDDDNDGYTTSTGVNQMGKYVIGGDCDNPFGQNPGDPFACHPDPEHPLKASTEAFEQTLPDWMTIVEHPGTELPP